MNARKISISLVAAALTVMAVRSWAQDAKPGLLLEVHLIEGDKLPEQPTGLSLAVFDDERPPSFGYAPVREAKELEPYRNKHLGLHWSGSFRITENGRHLFSAVSTQDISCRSVIKFGKVLLFNGQANLQGNNPVFNQENTLESGVYPFDCWMVCTEQGPLMIQLRMRGPHDRTITLVPSDRFSHSQ